MELVLLSGGSGQRLWPMSNEARSKQFLRVLNNNNFELESMVQRVWRQINNVNLNDNSYIATTKAQVEMIHNQLGIDIPVIVEPGRRDTFPAIALAAVYLYSEQSVSLDGTVVVMPVDPYVDDSFFSTIKDLEQILEVSNAELALIGVKPTYPSEKYGYIIPDTQTDIVSSSHVKVKSFREKPIKEEAEEMIRHAALWNCGVFAFKLDLIINILISRGFPIQYEDLIKQYDRLPKNSFDYEVVEHLEHIVVTPYAGEWKDLGTWNTLTKEMGGRVVGKGTITDDCHNTHLINELEIPVTVMGLSNVVVAASPDGILVSEKAISSRIKDVNSNISQRPMFEERRWGWYKIIDYYKGENGREVLTKRIKITVGKNLSYHYHIHRDEVWTVIAGDGELVLNGEYRRLKEGDVVVLPAGLKHSVKAVTELEIIEVQSGKQLIEEDIVRLCMSWDDVLTYIS